MRRGEKLRSLAPDERPDGSAWDVLRTLRGRATSWRGLVLRAHFLNGVREMLWSTLASSSPPSVNMGVRYCQVLVEKKQRICSRTVTTDCVGEPHLCLYHQGAAPTGREFCGSCRTWIASNQYERHCREKCPVTKRLAIMRFGRRYY